MLDYWRTRRRCNFVQAIGCILRLSRGRAREQPMTSLHCQASIRRPAAETWTLLRCPGNAAALFAPVLTDCSLDGDIRTVTFANGKVLRERIVDVDDERYRLCYTVLGDMFEHHSASMQIVPVDDRACRFVWISDILPDDRAALVGPLMEQGTRALVTNIETGSASTA
jgi:hypothetical protein